MNLLIHLKVSNTYGIDPEEELYLEIHKVITGFDPVLLYGEKIHADKSGVIKQKIVWNNITNKINLLTVYGMIKEKNADGKVLYNADGNFAKATATLKKGSTLAKQAGFTSAVKVGSETLNTNNGTCACKDYDLVWGAKVSCEFRKKVVEIAKNLGLPQRNNEGANWLMTIMALESAFTFSPKIGSFAKNPDENAKYKYIGLIQFGKAAAEAVGTTRTHLMSLTPEKQLDYVEKHFQLKQFKGLLNNRTALYLSVNYPNATKYASEKDYVVYDSNKDAYDDNPMFKREEHEFWIDKKGKKNYYKGKEGKSYVWEFEEALKEVEELGKSNKAKTFSCGIGNNSNVPLNAKDIVTYRIYNDGRIEKHIPKVIKEEYKNKYKYVYHDKNGGEHAICIVDWRTAQNWIKGSKHDSGKGWKKVGTRYYLKGEGMVELVKVPLPLNYSKDGLVIKASDNTEREYVNPKVLASIIGALAECNFNDVNFNGSTSHDGTGSPSVTHVNGVSIDFRYLRKDKTGANLHINSSPNDLYHLDIYNSLN